MNVKIDTTGTNKKPELNVKFQGPGKPGSFIQKGKELVPNLKDKATAAREELILKKDKPEENKL